MLRGTVVTLRPVREDDLAELYAHHIDIDNRGEYFPRGIMAQTRFVKEFHESGFWTKDEGMLVIANPDGRIIGHIEFFKTVNYLAEYELSYILYGSEHRGQGATTDAVSLMVRYLFETKPINRIRLVIHPGNAASRRIAEKCGFRHEGTARGAWYNAGRYQDVEIYAVLHGEVIGGDERQPAEA
jgi:RimJ/RimL family protein N-acetyltransferase